MFTRLENKLWRSHRSDIELNLYHIRHKEYHIYIKVFCFLCTFFHTFFFEFLIHFCVAACLHEWNVLYYISVLPSKVLICIIFYNFFLLTVTAFRASGTFN